MLLIEFGGSEFTSPGPEPKIVRATELEVRRVLCVIPVRPVPHISILVFPVGAPTVILVVIGISFLLRCLF